MILTCPECATSYFVDDSRIAEAGRTVKCTHCGARWTARREIDPSAEAEVASPSPTELPQPAPRPPTAEDLEIVAVARTPEIGRLRRRSGAVSRTTPKREAAGKVMIWAVSAGAVVILVVAAIVLRTQVVRAWPASQAAYAGLGLPVNSVGLVVEDVRIAPTFEAGRPVLAVSGAIRNVRDHAVDAPPIRISLLDRAGKTVAVKIARPLNAGVPAHATRHFALGVADPPAGIHDLKVVFDPAAKVAAEPAKDAGPAPIEAQPLPPGSPDAQSNASPTHD
jgi:predicted Zn finger-like uncharacterized protein